jgi:deoxyribodipyrimidine photo-lyase
MSSNATPSSVFPPTLEAARARLAAVRPDAYVQTRNKLDGAVTRLSPYLTHGLLTLPDVLRAVLSRNALPVQHKLVYELGWRAYFRHVWADRGEGILTSIHPGPLPDEAYARELPADVREARTGVPVIDQAVRTLYATGWLHNHARMWLASYIVHLRKVHWRTGADWLYGHLLDGDIASNHLSWQWVAGTGSHKPYLFNAENVQRFAPAGWHSPGTLLDTPYEVLDRIARDPAAVMAAVTAAVTAVSGGAASNLGALAGSGVTEPAFLSEPPASLRAVKPTATAVRGRDVWLVHPWSLGALPNDLPSGALVLGIVVDDFHRAFPWAPRRWDFVSGRMAEVAPLRWQGSAQAIASALAQARSVAAIDEPHLSPWLAGCADTRPPARLFPPVAGRCDSFTQWWTRTTEGLRHAHELTR